MKKLLLIFFILLSSGSLWLTGAAGIIPLPELPSGISGLSVAVDSNRLYIGTGTGASVYVYSMPDGKFLYTFGRQGEGLSDFREKIYTLTVQGDYLVINSVGKLSYFSKEGKYIKQLNTPAGDRDFRPFGTKFTGIGIKAGEKSVYHTINIYNRDLQEESSAVRLELGTQPGQGTKLFHGILCTAVCDNKLFVAGPKNFEIHVFNEEGIKTYFIRLEYAKRRITEEDKQWVLDMMENDPDTKEYFELMKPVIFPDFFPALREIYAADQKIYAFTWGKKDGNTECYVFDFQGKLLEITFLSIAYTDNWDISPLAIAGGKTYQTVKGVDNKWQLLVTDAR